MIDLNYPQHFHEPSSPSIEQIKQALVKAQLQPGAINMRYPSSMQLGGFSNPDASIRSEAIQMTIEGCHVASEVGASHLIIWPAYDGYDYQLQVLKVSLDYLKEVARV